MDQSSEYPPRYRHFPLFYVVSLFLITIFMIHFMQYTSEEIVPSMDNFKLTARDEEPTVKPLSSYNYSSLPICDFSRRVEKPRVNVSMAHIQFRTCSSALLLRFHGNPEGIMSNWQSTVSVCDQEPAVGDIAVRDIGADGWAILPSCQEKTTLVTMGIPKNTKMIDSLNEKIPDLATFGTDSFLKSSQKINNFYSFGLSEGDLEIPMEADENGATVNRTIKSKGVKEFLQNDLKLNKIDILWINPTYGNFPFWKYVHEEFRKLGIVVCQMLIEVPKGKGKQWIDTIKPLETSSNYIFMRPRTLANGSVRALFVNVLDHQCIRKYLE